MEDEEQKVPEDSFESRLVSLRSSSLNAQSEVLRKIQADIEDSEHKTNDVLPLLPHLLATYSRQFQRKPRKLVQSCLRAFLRSDVRDAVQSAFSNFLLAESLKAVVAVTNALVLLEWSNILLDEVTARDTLDLNVLRQTCTAAAAFLDKCLTQGTRGGISHAASVGARRGIRKTLQSQHGAEALHAMLTELAQSASARPANAPYIGLLARASVRVPSLHEQVASLADKIIDYFIKVILGAKAVLPWHDAHGLDYFFAEYAVSSSITSTIVPTLEKAILRSPENVLHGPIIALAQSLPSSIDCAESVLTKLLKPLSSSLTSTNAVIRDGAAQTLFALLTRGGDKLAMIKIVKELVATAKASKTSASDVRCAISDCLGGVAVKPEFSLAIVQGLLPIAAKENNEIALDRELNAVATHASGLIDCDQWTKDLSDHMFKGFVEKRAPFKKLWILNAGKSLLGITRKPEEKVVIDFVNGSLSAAIDVYEELSQHPLPAAQAGTIAMAYVPPALLQNPIVVEFMSDMKTKASPKSVGSSAVHSTSYLTNPKVYSRLVVTGDQSWALLALMGVSDYLVDADNAGKSAWGRMLLHLLLAPEIDSSARKSTGLVLAKRYLDNAAPIGQSVVLGIWDYICEDNSNAVKKFKVDEAPSKLALKRAVTCISPPSKVWQQGQRARPQEALEHQAVSTVVLYGPKLVPGVEWAENLLQIGVDPGQLACDHSEALMREILSCFEQASMQSLSLLESEACRAAATLVFVSPNVFGPRIIKQIMSDLDESSLQDVGSTEVTIALTPDGVLVVDPNVTSNGHVENKNVKDYKTLKWEEELKAELAKKKGTQKKLTSDQQAKVDAQLKREGEIRQRVKDLSHKLRRGAGLVHALAVGPPTDARLWMSPAVASIIAVLRAGAALCTDEELVTAYLACSHHVTDRLGTMRPFIGVAALRALGDVGVPTAMEGEPLEELATRVLYRLRFAAEQRPLDTASLAYSLPLIFTTLETGHVGNTASAEDADAQVLLALEFLSFQMETCSDEHLPRAELLRQLISAMQKYPQHYRLVKDTLLQLTSSVAANISSEEQEVLLQATTSSDSSVRSAALQSIHNELDLSESNPSVNIWIACQDADEDSAETALAIWEESGFRVSDNLVQQIPSFLFDKAQSTRSSAAKALAQALLATPAAVSEMRVQLQTWYQEEAQPLVPKADKFGIVQRGEIVDPWHKRSGIALAFKELSDVYSPDDLLPMIDFLVSDGALADRNERVRDEMLEAGTTLVTRRGKECLEALMSFFEKVLKQTDKATKEADLVNEGVIVLYGFLAMHLPKGDSRLKNVLSELVQTLSTPSESVQYAVANCLPPLVRAAGSDADPHIPALLEQLLQGKQYAVRRGAAYGLAGIVKGDGISVLRQFRIMSALKTATDDKKNAEKRQGAMMAYELLSSILGRTFEPYVVDVLPQLLACFGDPVPIVREACLDTAKACFSSLSSYGVHQVLPQLLEGLEETQWRSKKGACDLLGAMAYLDPQQLAASLPDIIPPLTAVLTDSHKEVRASANSSLKRFGEVISNPEVKSLVDVLLKALSDPTKYTEEALDGLIKISFTHYLDSPSLALIVRILERGLNDRSSTKRKAAQIIGSLAHLTEKRDIVIHLPILVSGLRAAAIDPVPATRATASKALGSLVEKLGEDALPDLIPSLMGSLRTDAGASDRLGSAQALSEVLAGLGTGRLEETLPTILQNVASTRATVREGFMTLFIFLPACFGNSFANYLAQIIPSVLSGLADDIEAIRDTALRAGRLLVKNFATKSIDLLLPELQRGLADNNYRIRLSSVELVGDLLFNLTGISAQMEAEEEDDNAAQAGQSLLEVLGEDRRNRVLSSLYICRCDTSGLVRTAALAVWKALVATPRTLREIVPTLTQMIITRLGSVNAEQKHIAANALGEVIRKSGEGIFNSLLPALEEGLESSTDADNRQGICIALREVITAAQHESIEDHEQHIIGILRTALVDSDDDVRDAAAEAFDSLQQIVGNRAVNQVLPHLLKLLSNDDDAENALAALLTLLTEQTRANAILPNLIPTLIASPISAFNAQALASLAKVGGSAMNRRLPTILNSLADNIIACKDDDRKVALESAFDAVLCSVDEFDGLNTAMSVMLQMIKHDDHYRRSVAAKHFAVFFTSSDVDFSRYNQDLIRVLLISFDDRDKVVVTAAWNALSALQQHLRKEEMESLTPYTAQTLRQVGTPGHNLPGFMLPKGIQPVMQIFLQGLMNGNGDQRLQAAHGISDMIDKAGPDALKAFVTQITGPLIRVVGDKSTDLKVAIIGALIQLLEKIATFLRPFLPQLQRTFTKCIADPASDMLRNKAIRALSILIAYTPRVDPLITELTTGAKTSDPAVRNSMLKALQEVVGKVGAKMSEASRDTILDLMDQQNADEGDLMITMAKLLGGMVKVLPPETGSTLIKSRVLVQPSTPASILALNAVLAENAHALTDTHLAQIRATLTAGVQGPTFIQHNSVLAIGKLFLTDDIIEDEENNQPVFDAIASKIKQGSDIDTRRLCLVVIRTLSRHHNETLRAYIPVLILPIYQSLRDPVIPVKLAAEAAFLQLFDVVDSESEVFDQFVKDNTEAGSAGIPAPVLRSVSEYFKRIALKLAGQRREQREAEGGVKGSLGLGSDEVEDEKEVWSVGKVDLGEGFSVDD